MVDLLLARFKLEGRPAHKMLTEGQKIIFYNLVFRPSKRLQIICSTQYGKTLVVALACLVIACIQEEIVAIVAPSAEKAKLTMRYFVEHLGDDRIFYTRLERNTRLDRLRQEDSKSRIILNNGGGIFVVSSQEKNSLKSIESAMGMGARIVIGDEYCLINDDNEATIFRMIAGKGADGFYCKIGNPFYNTAPYTHFENSWNDPRYTKIFIDYKQAIKEGRYQEDFIDEARGKPLFDILFACKFPEKNLVDKNGFRTLIMAEQIRYADERGTLEVEEEVEDKLNHNLYLGVDIGGGGDKSTFVMRLGELTAWTESSLLTINTMDNVAEIERLQELYHIPWENISIDDTGIGRGVSDRLIELGHNINAVSFGESAMDNDLFLNRRAEMYWDAKEWLINGGKLLNDPASLKIAIQMGWIKWKLQSGEKKIKLMDKDTIRKIHKQSPDEADGFVLTFYKKPYIGFI